MDKNDMEWKVEKSLHIKKKNIYIYHLVITE